VLTNSPLKNGISYKEALKAAGPEYRKLKEN
jgi:hypothetical protein